jgi:4-hydroxybenzoate decarboxylase subunit C
MHHDLRGFIRTLQREGEIVEIAAEVDPYLEIAEIHRRVIEEQGKALLFTECKGLRFSGGDQSFRHQAPDRSSIRDEA